MRAAIFMLSVLLFPLALPGAVAWRADGWLTQEVIGGERLAHGDEFGCHGMPGADIFEDSSIVQDCKSYLTSQINASKWGENPLSYGISSADVDSSLANVLTDSGFRIIGDSPTTDTSSALWSIERSGGSLEQNVASIDGIEQAIEENGYVNLYWEAEIEDLNVRRDRDVLSWIENQDYWFTTWGEWYSSSHVATESDRTSESITLKGSPYVEGGWDVPGTTLLSIEGGQISSVERLDENPLNTLTIENRELEIGYRILNDSAVVMTLPEGAMVQVIWEGPESEIEISSHSFNNLTPFMAVGHHTTDLFEWSNPFRDSPLKFTWLIEPQPEIEPSWILPLIAILTVLVAPIAIRITLKHDQEMHHYSEEE